MNYLDYSVEIKGFFVIFTQSTARVMAGFSCNRFKMVIELEIFLTLNDKMLNDTHS